MARQFRYLGLLTAAIGAGIILSACGGATPTATQTSVTTQPTEAVAATKRPTETTTPTQSSTGQRKVIVHDQAVKNGTVTVDEVVPDAQGWIVIHADNGGKAGPVIGYAAVNQGDNKNVVVNLTNLRGITTTLYAMLHLDAGIVGKYEFPGADIPVLDARGNVISPAFIVVFDSAATPGARATSVAPPATPALTDTPTPTINPNRPPPPAVTATTGVCQFACPVGMTAYKCDSKAVYCSAAVGHCEVDEECNTWCSQSFPGIVGFMNFYCLRSKDPATGKPGQGVCVCSAKKP
jgi:hypothetical protein